MAELTTPNAFLNTRTRSQSDVTPGEWRWVILVGGLLTLITLLPYIWAFNQTSGSTAYQFNGFLVNPKDGATYLAKIAEGMHGQWLFTIAHTPEATSGTFLFEFYLFLGHIGSLLGLSPLLTFHVARIAATLIMYLAFYILAAEIWQQPQSRRLFFLIMAVGSGLGWLTLLFAPGIQSVDLYVPEAFPFYSSFLSPHFAAAFALLALLAAAFIHAFRPGHLEMPGFSNGGLIVGFASVCLVIILPQAWLPFAAALIVYVIFGSIESRRLPSMAMQRWIALVLFPATLVVLYDFIIANVSPQYAIWNAQNQTLAGSPINYLFGYGLLIVVAFPAIIRAVRRLEQDGDRLMLIWLIITIILIYAPTNIQRRFSTDLIIPMAYFATRALLGFWAERFKAPRARWLAWFVLFVPLMLSNALLLVGPLTEIASPAIGLQANQLIPTDYAQAITWLKARSTPDTIVLAPPSISLWIPGATGARVVYGHPFETLNAADKLARVNAWYAGQGCQTLLSQYRVAFVLIGATDSQPTKTPDPYVTSPCLASLGKPIATFNTVTIYDTASSKF